MFQFELGIIESTHEYRKVERCLKASIASIDGKAKIKQQAERC